MPMCGLFAMSDVLTTDAGEWRGTWLTVANLGQFPAPVCGAACRLPNAMSYLGTFSSTSCTFCLLVPHVWIGHVMEWRGFYGAHARMQNEGTGSHGARLGRRHGGERGSELGEWACVRGECRMGPSLIVVGRSPLAGWHPATWRAARPPPRWMWTCHMHCTHGSPANQGRRGEELPLFVVAS
ncbi:hypothetical protein SEVIR_2G383901v4 [Setaria viridis]